MAGINKKSYKTNTLKSTDDTIPIYNNTNFPLLVRSELDLPKPDSDVNLKYNQWLVKEFYKKFPYLRGLLIYHAMGTGKTRIPIAIAEMYKSIEPSRKVIILLSKSLENNFKKNIQDFSNKGDAYIEENYKFISLNAGNMYKQLYNIEKSKEEVDMENRLGIFMEREGSLENTMLVVDEAHNLFNGITNGSKNAVKFYDMIMNTKNIKLVFLSGTPIINDPFELVPCFNMLRGYIYTSADKFNSNTEQLTLFAEDEEEFDDFFIDKENKAIKNREKFINRIYGLVSYYGDLYFQENTKEDFPTELPLVVRKCNMSKLQFTSYMEARHNEQQENKKRFGNKGRFSSGGSASSSYRVKTRQISNYCIPEYALGPLIGKKSRKKYIDKITVEDLKDTDKWSPKFSDILNNIKKHEDSPGFVYSQFLEAGLVIFSKVLEVNGYENYDDGINDYTSGESPVASPVASPDGGSPVASPTSVGVVKKSLGGYDDDDIKFYMADVIDYSETATSNAANIKSKKENHKTKSKRNKQGGTDLNNKVEIKSKKSFIKKYAILSGDIKPEKRTEIINIFNSTGNKNGEIIHLLLLSGALSEGTDLKRIRHLHIMEPYWNFLRVRQVITRAVRYRSHIDLPKEKQNVQPYLYLSDYMKDYPPQKIKEPTTDVELYSKSIDNMKLINEFTLAIAESSIDCSIHTKSLPEVIKSKIKCKLCLPTNKVLFYPSIMKDMELPSNCIPYEEKKVNVKEILFGDNEQKYYYDYNNETKELKLYEFNPKINGYIKMQRTAPYYSDIISLILQKEM